MTPPSSPAGGTPVARRPVHRGAVHRVSPRNGTVCTGIVHHSSAGGVSAERTRNPQVRIHTNKSTNKMAHWHTIVLRVRRDPFCPTLSYSVPVCSVRGWWLSSRGGFSRLRACAVRHSISDISSSNRCTGTDTGGGSRGGTIEPERRVEMPGRIKNTPDRIARSILWRMRFGAPKNPAERNKVEILVWTLHHYPQHCDRPITDLYHRFGVTWHDQ